MTQRHSVEDRREHSLARQVVPATGGETPRVNIRYSRSLRFARLTPSPKRIRWWRDRRMSALLHGRLVSHRRTSFASPHKSKQRRVLRHRH